MLTLGNDELHITFLDPVADEARLGTRYVSGGYIHQIEDARLGPLFSGPVYPEDPPPTFHGQGLPEAFRTSVDAIDGQQLLLGNSLVKVDERGRPGEVLERCRWRIEEEEATLRMSTTQQHGVHHLSLHHEVALTGRTLVSSTRIANLGAEGLPIAWFAHPFFPWPDDGICCRFDAPATLEDNPGFRVNSDGFIERVAEHDWQKGQFVYLEGLKGRRLDAVMHHPTRGQMRVTGTFEMAEMPIWGNACTVSFEPYLRTEVAPQTSLDWSLTYHL